MGAMGATPLFSAHRISKVRQKWANVQVENCLVSASECTNNRLASGLCPDPLHGDSLAGFMRMGGNGAEGNRKGKKRGERKGGKGEGRGM